MDEWREPTGRNCHRTAVVDNELFLWGGNVYQDRPKVHNSPEKCQFYSSVEVCETVTGSKRTHVDWEWRATPVLLSTQQCSHTEHLYPGMEDAGVQKTSCGMVHFTDGEEDHLYVVGGYGHATPSSPQHVSTSL